jgi:signal transduction histidine kinase
MLDRLESALEREREFVAEAGHELRTPLALLRAELDLALRHGEDADELREAVRKAGEETDRLAQLAEDLLLIARSDREGLVVQRRPTDLDDLLGSVARRFERRARHSGRAIEVQTRPGAAIDADAGRLEQALSNLVDNALRHGAGTIRVSARRDDGVVELRVADGGVGFPDEFLGRAFERFSRAHPSGGSEGAGLGLAIVQTIARAHAGEAYAANSKDGGGAEVWLRLPATGS